MMNFLPQGYSFQSDSNPYQHQFISTMYGSGQYGSQYSPMNQTGPRLPTCEPGTCPPWLPPGIVATPSSGVQELSVLFDPSLASRMARAYDPWSVAYWGKPDVPAWLWPDGAAPHRVPPNVMCDVPPVGVPTYVPPGGGGGGRPPQDGPVLTPAPVPSSTPKFQPPSSSVPGTQFQPPSSVPGTQFQPAPGPRPQPTPGPTLGPGPTGGTMPKSTPNPGYPLRRGMFNKNWSRAGAPSMPTGLSPQSSPITFSSMPPPSRVVAPQPAARKVPSCHNRPDQESCVSCCASNSTTKGIFGQCKQQCVGLPPKKPEGGPSPSGTLRDRAKARVRAGAIASNPANLTQTRRSGRSGRSARRRGAGEKGYVALPGRPRGWCGPGEHLCHKKGPGEKSHLCCCRTGSSDCAGGKTVLAFR